jgi:hypothetical protein
MDRLRNEIGGEARNLHHVVNHHRVKIFGVDLPRQRVIQFRQIDEIVTRKPLVLGDLLQRVAALGFNDQHVTDQMFALLRHEERDPKFSADDDAAQVVKGRAIERQGAAHEHVKDDTEAPNVCTRSIILESLEHLGSRIWRRAAECFQVNSLGECVAEAKVSKLKKKAMSRQAP